MNTQNLQICTPQFKGLTIKRNITDGVSFINQDKEALTNLGKSYDIVIKQGIERSSDGTSAM